MYTAVEDDFASDELELLDSSFKFSHCTVNVMQSSHSHPKTWVARPREAVAVTRTGRAVCPAHHLAHSIHLHQDHWENIQKLSWHILMEVDVVGVQVVADVAALAGPALESFQLMLRLGHVRIQV